MNPAAEDLDADDPRLLQAARAYLADLEAGRAPNRAAYFAANPDLTADLKECFDDIDFAHAGTLAIRPSPPPPAELLAQPLGDFKILRELGRGGMGVVYEAVQLSLGRRVALKVLPFAAALDAKHLQRFNTESHAAAQLHHPNIVPVHAVGCERGIHYYAMQLIDGRTLDAVIRAERGEEVDRFTADTGSPTVKVPIYPGNCRRKERHRDRRPPRSADSFRSAARLAAQVADALGYAHEAGVIHRDIKPANLLLDGNGTVWVTDFGLAQVTADVSLTQSGDVMGTLRYMSPEQASGKRLLVDHRTDVYSLGATLYELLTLEPIFPGQDQHALLQQILSDEPRPPRQVERGIPADLETIALKALAKVPDERYAAAGELAADLRRFLDERPILARRPSVWDRGRKWLRRHPSYVAAAVILLAVGTIALAASTTVVLWKQRQTDGAYRREKQRAIEAEERFQLARQSADEMILIADQELTDSPEQQRLRRRLLETAHSYYLQLIELRRNEPDSKSDLEATRARLEKVLADLAVMRGADRHMLLSEPAVQDDLRLSNDQRTRLVVVFREIVGYGPVQPRDVPKASMADRSQQLLAEMRAHETAIEAILTPAQLARLKQIALQARGPQAFGEPEVAAALALTAEQREVVRTLDGGPPGGRGGPGPGPGGPGGPGSRPPGRPPERDRPPDINRILALLSPEQLAVWRKLTGEPCIGLRTSPGRGPGRPGSRP